ncbi:MAG: hypothetical protein AAGJ35_13415, partial [Myxococcota bacterium]
FAHQQNLLHNNLRPEHIIVGPLGEVKVLGWKDAKDVHFYDKGRKDSKASQERTYRSPEYIELGSEEKSLDERSDIYALCSILFEFLSLHAPNPVRKGKCWVWPKLHRIRQEYQRLVPKVLTKIVLKGLCERPDDRYSSVLALFHALQYRYIEGNNRIGGGYTLVRRFTKGYLQFLDTHPWMGSLLALSAFSLMVAGGSVMVAWVLRLWSAF